MNVRTADTAARPGTSALRVGLTLGGIVLAAVVIFGLGVMEGSRVAERVPEVAAPPSALPTETLQPRPSPTPAPAVPSQPDTLTFYDRLSGSAPPPPMTLPTDQPPVQPPVQEQPPATPAAQEARTQPAKAQPPRPQAAAAPRTAVARPAVRSKPDATARIRKLSGSGRFAVQIAAVSDRAGAAKTAAVIKSNGFEPVTVMVSVKGRILYRIRVGSFPNKPAAAEAAELFRSAFGLSAIPVEN